MPQPYAKLIVAKWGTPDVTTLRAYVYHYSGGFVSALGPLALTEFDDPDTGDGTGIYWAYSEAMSTAFVSPVVLVNNSATGEWELGEIQQLANVVRANGRELEPRTLLPVSASITSPVDVSDGDRLHLIQGDDHTSGAKLPTWEIAGYDGPSLSGASCVLRLLNIADYNKRGAAAAAALEVTATVSQVGTTVTVTAAITAEQSAALATYPPGDETTHKYQVLATTDGGAKTTLKLGNVTVSRRIEAA